MYKYGTILILTKHFSENSYCIKNTATENALGKLFLPHYHANILYPREGEWITVKGRGISTQRFNKLRDFLKTFLLHKLILNFGNFHIMKVTSFNHILLPGALKNWLVYYREAFWELSSQERLILWRPGNHWKNTLSEVLQNLAGFTIDINTLQKPIWGSTFIF